MLDRLMGRGKRKGDSQIQQVLENALRPYSLFKGVDADQLATLAPALRVKEYGDEEIVCSCPDANHDAFLLLKRVVCITVQKGADTHVLELGKMGTVFNMAPLFGLEKDHTGARALGCGLAGRHCSIVLKPWRTEPTLGHRFAGGQEDLRLNIITLERTRGTHHVYPSTHKPGAIALKSAARRSHTVEATLKVKVRFFALYRERAGRNDMSLELEPGATVSELVEQVRRLFPNLAPPTVDIVVAVNTEYAGPGTPLHDGDDIALIPPVSGGEDMIEITRHPLDPEEVTAKVRKDTNGAVVTFLGATRVFAEGQKVLYLEYEAYEEMALKEMEKIRQEIESEWHIQDMAISHRIGRVDIGEISLVVAIASPHRKEAFLACHQAVNRLKESVPIWKKEFFEDGYHWVACEEHEHPVVQEVS